MDGYLYRRHTLPIRLTHWINVLALMLLLMSGLQIFNAHPNLYWGKSSYTGTGPILEMRAGEAPDGARVGVTRVFGHEFTTTGLLGLSRNRWGELVERGFPSWATLPSGQWLAMGRRWHFFFGWVFVINAMAYLTYSIVSRHLMRDLAVHKSDWRTVGRSVLEHLRLHHPRGEAARRYNVLQKLSYLVVIFGLLPFLVLTGLAMSPWLDSVLPGWVDLLGGRQSARTLHFAAVCLLVLFVLIHVFEVIVTGLWNNLRSMITGAYRIEPDSRT